MSSVIAVFCITLKCRRRSKLVYRLDPAHWNRGLITEAVRDYAFVGLKLPRVISLIHPENIPSRRVAEKIGLMPEKEITFRGFPTIVFALSREHWQAAHAAG